MIVGMSMQTFFSIQHVRAATYFARESARLQKRMKKSATTLQLSTPLKATVTAALFSSVAFLEATINEIYAEAEKENGLLGSIDPNASKLIAYLWESGEIDRASVMNKFSILLAAASRDPLDKGSKTCQEVKSLISLRNALMHYKSSWLDIGTEGMVRKGALTNSGLIKSISSSFEWLPGSSRSDGWMSADCAIWSAESSINYANYFFERLDIVPTYSHVLEDLKLPDRNRVKL